MISVIIVNYRTRRYLRQAIRAISEHVSSPYEVIIIDNNSGDDLSFVKDINPKTRLIYHTKNGGFGSGANRGAKEASGEWLIFLNPDTKLQGNPVWILTEANDDVGVIGLCLQQGRKVQPYQCGSFPTPWGALLGDAKKHWKTYQTQEFLWVDWVSGGSLCVRKDLFWRVHGFDERYFMYYEDIDLCHMIRNLGYRVGWSPTVVVDHVEGGSEPIKWKVKQRYYASQRKYFAKWFSPVWQVCLTPIHWLWVKILGMLEKR